MEVYLEVYHGSFLYYKYRKKRIEKINEDIQTEEWRNYFTELLEGTRKNDVGHRRRRKSS